MNVFLSICAGPSGKTACVHGPVRSHLEVFLNKHASCILLIQVLHETYEALASISKLSSTPHFGVISTVCEWPLFGVCA